MIPEVQPSPNVVRPPDLLDQCQEAFVEWLDSLDPQAYGNQGNIVAVPAIDCGSTSIRVNSTETKMQAPVNDERYLGVHAKKHQLVHGGVVALYSNACKAFLNMTNGVVSPKACPLLSIESKGALFLVIDLGYDYFAFRSIDDGQLLGINRSYVVHGMWSSTDLAIGSATDVDVIESIPDDAVFWVRSELSDGSTISLYSPARQRFLRVNNNGVVDVWRAAPGDCESYYPILVMDAAGLGGLDESCTWVPRSRLGRKFTIQLSARAFSTWRDKLVASTRVFDGNVVAKATEGPISNGIITSELVQKMPTPPTAKQLGKLADVGSISHCNVIALHCVEHNSFLVLDAGQIRAAGPSPATSIPADSRRCVFLVVELGDHQFAFYHIHYSRFLVAMSPEKIVAIQAKTSIESSKVSDEVIISQLPQEAIFNVQRESSNGSVVSLKSKRFHTYLTVNGDKTVHAAATCVRASQKFRIVLIMRTKLLPK
jgi:hypothetical protein